MTAQVDRAWLEERVEHYRYMVQQADASHERHPTEGYQEEAAFMAGHEWAFLEILRHIDKTTSQ